METQNELIVGFMRLAEKREKIEKSYAHISKEMVDAFLFAVCYSGEARLSYKIFDFTNIHSNTAVKLKAYYRCITEKKFNNIALHAEHNKKVKEDFSPKYLLRTYHINKQMTRLIYEIVNMGAEFKLMLDPPSKILISAGSCCTLKKKIIMADRPYPNKPNKPHSDGPIMKVSGVNRMRFDA